MDSKKSHFNVVIVGSGFSGLVAANILADTDLSILLIDENIHIGGQLLRKIPEELGQYSAYHPIHIKRVGFAFIESLQKKRVKTINRAIVIGIYADNNILVEVGEKEILCIHYDVILFTTGAREKFIPFKGWTLPGVYSTGLVQVLMKSSGVLPAEKIMIAGSGLFLLAAAYEVLKNGARVLAILEQTPMLNKLKLLSQFFHQFSKFCEGARFLSRIYLSRVPVRYKTKIIEARGKESLEEVVSARVDKTGQVIPGSEKTTKTDALAVGYGFAANIELPQLAGCELEFCAAKGGWVVKVDERLETSRGNIFAAGEITGIAGAKKSINEGKIAALAILERFGKIDDNKFASRLKRLTRERKHHLAFGKYFNLLYKPPHQSILDIPDDTIVCRCEDVTMGDIKKAVKKGYNTPVSLKVAIRTGMGNCQGRICAANIENIIAALTDTPQEEVGRFTVRPPIKPVTIAALSELKTDSSVCCGRV